MKLTLNLGSGDRVYDKYPEKNGYKCRDWRNLAQSLRKVAHKIHRMYNRETQVEGFLKLIK